MAKDTIDFTKTPLTEIYGVNCFNDAKMRERLPKTIYKELKSVQSGDKELSLEVAEVVANAMKDWAIENGATHYTHWFQPLTGLTAEKHDAFISPTADGRVIMEFSGKELIKGEPDASSFPSGGLRATFEARGYTAWDTTSPAFLKEDNSGVTLYIPTAFISYTGEALDKKVPLLRSMQAISAEAVRLLRALGNTTTKRVITTVGPEQEYFLVEKEYFDKRLDLQLSGRTLFGKLPPKGQEMEDHYFGSIKERVAVFMRELNYELWKLGIPAKTQHNEVAPNQFELAPIYSTTNVACDTNQLLMDTMKKVASHYNLVALLHEKPFAGINGSGKHNNWSMGTDDGMNLLEPGTNPKENAQFLVFLVAVLKAVDKYATILRYSAANTGNDHRLGANEAPPAIISVFLGSQLEDILEAVATGKPAASLEGGKIELGVTALPKLPKDLTDRNRTSPFAFTGNKFEFRMVPSSESIAGPNVALNTIVADVVGEFADIIEKAGDKKAAIQKLITETYAAHKRIIFNGNNYTEEWVKEAEKRGLPNIKSTVEALLHMSSDLSMTLFTKHKVFTPEELKSREEIYLEKYIKQINIESGVMVDMFTREIYPAATDYMKTLADAVHSVRIASSKADISSQEKTLVDLAAAISFAKVKADELEMACVQVRGLHGDTIAQAKASREKVFAKMAELRTAVDRIETIVPKKAWPFPGYEELLFKL